MLTHRFEHSIVNAQPTQIERSTIIIAAIVGARRSHFQLSILYACTRSYDLKITMLNFSGDRPCDLTAYSMRARAVCAKYAKHKSSALRICSDAACCLRQNFLICIWSTSSTTLRPPSYCNSFGRRSVHFASTLSGGTSRRRRRRCRTLISSSAHARMHGTH